MKKFTLVTFILIYFGHSVYAQESIDNQSYNKNGSMVWISLTNGAFLGKGLLWKVSMDSLEFISQEFKNQNLNRVPILKIHYSEIKVLKTTPRAAIKKGMLTGALIGFASGMSFGMATTENPDPYTKTEMTSGGCLLFVCIPPSTYTVEVDEPRDALTVIIKTLGITALGTVVGLVIGNKYSIEGEIDGSREKYQALVPELKKQAFWGTMEVKAKKKT